MTHVEIIECAERAAYSGYVANPDWEDVAGNMNQEEIGALLAAVAGGDFGTAVLLAAGHLRRAGESFAEIVAARAVQDHEAWIDDTAYDRKIDMQVAA